MFDFVVIVTPNHVHYDVAKSFAEAGIHVVCDKPLVHTTAQAEDLVHDVFESLLRTPRRVPFAAAGS